MKRQLNAIFLLDDLLSNALVWPLSKSKSQYVHIYLVMPAPSTYIVPAVVCLLG